jgi:hypothetical protein
MRMCELVCERCELNGSTNFVVTFFSPCYYCLSPGSRVGVRTVCDRSNFNLESRQAPTLGPRHGVTTCGGLASAS